MIVIYAEKFDVGVKIAAALGGFDCAGRHISMKNVQAQKALLNKEFKGQGFIPFEWNGQACAVVWGQGHMCELKQAAEYDPAYAQWKNLPRPYIPARYEIRLRRAVDRTSGKALEQDDPWALRQMKVIDSLFKKADLIINATDDDREGELIFAYVYEYLHCKKPYKRVRLDSQTQEGFEKAFSNLLDASKVRSIEQAGRCRAIADWVTGANLTAQMTLKYGRFLPSLPVISIGRIQTVVLDFIVEREKALQSFQAQPFWTVSARFKTPFGDCFAAKSAVERFDSEHKAKAYVASLKGAIPVVEEVETNSSQVAVPLLYNLASLSRAANKKYGYTAKETLELVQQMYELGFVTYPRTESEVLTDDMGPVVDETIKMLCAGNTQYAACLQNHPADQWKHDRRHYDSSRVDSHFAIIPTSQKADGLNERQAAIYDLLARSLLKTVFSSAVTEKTALKIRVGEALFLASGSVVRDPQWLVLDDHEKADCLPEVFQSDLLQGEYEIKTSSTQPPKRYTDASLLLAMQTASRSMDDQELKKILQKTNKGGIGRPSTQSSIIETVVSRYCTRQGRQIVPNAEGMKVIEMLPVEDLKSAVLTAKWEQDLDQVAAGKKDMDAFIADIERNVARWVEQIEADQKVWTMQSTESSCGLCPACKSPVMKTRSGWACSGWSKQPGGCQFYVPGTLCGQAIKQKEVDRLIRTGRSGLLKGLKKKETGETFCCHLVVGENGRLKMTNTTGYACPICGADLIQNDKGIYCSGYKGGCGLSIPAVLLQKRLPASAVQALMEGRETELIKGFVSSKSKKSFDARLALDMASGKVKFLFAQAEPDEHLRCPACLSAMLVGRGYVKCSDASCGLSIGTEILGQQISRPQLEKLCSEKGSTDVMDGFVSKKTGRPFSASLRYDAAQRKVVMVFPEPDTSCNLSCVLCHSPVSSSSRGYRCTKCSLSVYREYAGVALDEEVMKQLITTGQTGQIVGFVSRAGKFFDAALVVDPEKKKVEFDFAHPVVNQDVRCPICQAAMSQTVTSYQCANCHKVRVPRWIGGVEIGPEDMSRLFAGQPTEPIEGVKKRQPGNKGWMLCKIRLQMKDGTLYSRDA